jgi:hypothetical protein
MEHADDLILLTECKATTKVITTLQEIPNAPKSLHPKKTEVKIPAYQPATPQPVPNPYAPSKAGTPQPAPGASALPAATPAASGT